MFLHMFSHQNLGVNHGPPKGLISHGVIGAYLATVKGFPAADFYQKHEYGISEGMVFYNKRLSS